MTVKTISLREFQRGGAKALETVESSEPWLLVGREQEFLLLPLLPETRTAMLDLAEGLAAVAALRQDQARAVEAGLDQLTMDEINAEIRATRQAKCRKSV